MCLCLLWDTDLAEFNPPVLHQALQETCFTSRGPAGEARTRVRSREAVRQDPRDVSEMLTGWPEGSHCDPLSLGWRSAEEASCLGVGSRAVSRCCRGLGARREHAAFAHRHVVLAEMALCSSEKHKGAQWGSLQGCEAGKRPLTSILQPRLVSSVVLADILLRPPLALHYRTKHTQLLIYTLLLSKNT